MNKTKSPDDIDEALIQSWKTPEIERILHSPHFEEKILTAYENGLYQTSSNPKIGPREMIFILTTKTDLDVRFVKEIKSMTRVWLESLAADWNDNVTPFYAAEAEYILANI